MGSEISNSCVYRKKAPCHKHKFSMWLSKRESYQRAPLHSINDEMFQMLSCFNHIVIFTTYNDVIISAMASQITNLKMIYSTVCSGVDQRKHQSSASLAFVCAGNSPVTGKCFPLMTSSCTHLSVISLPWPHVLWWVFLGQKRTGVTAALHWAIDMILHKVDAI